MGLPNPSITRPSSPGPTSTGRLRCAPPPGRRAAARRSLRAAWRAPGRSRKPITWVRMRRPPAVAISQKSPIATFGPRDSISSPATSVTSPVQRSGEIAVEFAQSREPGKCVSLMAGCAGGPRGRVQSPAAAIRWRRPGSPRSVSKMAVPGGFRADPGSPRSARRGTAFRRQSAISCACDGWTLTREISWPRSFSSAPRTSRFERVGIHRQLAAQHAPGDGERQFQDVGLRLAAQARAHLPELADGLRELLHDRLKFRRRATAAGGLTFPQSGGLRIPRLLLELPPKLFDARGGVRRAAAPWTLSAPRH